LCGIAGIALKPEAPPLDLERLVPAMCRAMTHRGPDDSGAYFAPEGRAALGNSRLAVRDLSPAGHMPMGSASGRTWITYNGEIYNAAELRAELEARGCRFSSASDTEVILHAYETWGPAAVSRLRGMFAFAILDLAEGRPRLFLARDRLGIKPLFYAQTGSAFVFASELKGLRATELFSKEIDPAALAGYLLFGSVPCPLTIFREIRALEAGHTLTWEQGELRTQRYWQPRAEEIEVSSREEAREMVRRSLEDAVRSHLVSDAPLGAFLSGGLDSSVLVALMRKSFTGSLRTCSIGFAEKEFDETEYARELASAFGAEHYENRVTHEDLRSELDRILWAMDQPTINGVNSYFVSRTAREAGLTVALSGLGGDEIFGGYANTFEGIPWILRSMQIAGAVPGGKYWARGAARVLPSRRPLIKFVDALASPASPAAAYCVSRGLFSPREAESLVGAEIWDAAKSRFDSVAYVAARAERGGSSLFSWVSRAELSNYTQNQLLRDTDVMSMAHSLEVRVPLLDHLLLESVLKLPGRVKCSGRLPKSLLREAAGAELPPRVRDRAGKRGFTFPLGPWLKGPLAPLVREALAGRQLEKIGLLRAGSAAALVRKYEQGRLHWSRLWAVVVLHLWQAALEAQ